MQADPGAKQTKEPAGSLNARSGSPERAGRKNISYAEVAGGGKRGHPQQQPAPAQQSSRDDEDGSKPSSPFQSPNAKIQKRDINDRRSQSRTASRNDESQHTDRRSGRPSQPWRSKQTEKEKDPKRLAARQKQIDFGKNTIGYQRYTSEVPRQNRTAGHPWTPDRDQICSKRSWDGQVRKWRRMLHEYDPPGTKYPDDENGEGAADGADDLQPDEGLLADSGPSTSASASASSSSLPAKSSSTSIGIEAPKPVGAQRKLMWSDAADEDEEEMMHELQPPPNISTNFFL